MSDEKTGREAMTDSEYRNRLIASAVHQRRAQRAGVVTVRRGPVAPVALAGEDAGKVADLHRASKAKQGRE